MKVRRPAAVDPLLWEHLPRAARLALASRYASTPERAAALRGEADRLTVSGLERAVKTLEQALKKNRGEQ